MNWRHRPLAVAVAGSLLLHGLLLLALPLMSTRRQPAPAPLQIELLAAAGPKAALPAAPAVSTHARAARSSISPSTVPTVAPAAVRPVPSLSASTDLRPAIVAPPGAADAVALARSGADGEQGNASVSTVHAAIEPARFLGNVRNPPYPERARVLGLEGRVEVKVTVGAGGEVLNVELLRSSGQPELDRAALALLGAGPYAPARRAGVAMASRLRIGVPYTLNK